MTQDIQAFLPQKNPWNKVQNSIKVLNKWIVDTLFSSPNFQTFNIFSISTNI